jgi:hypothetical protein
MMAVATFDTLKYAKALRAAGVSEEQAEAQSAALMEALQVNLKELANKDDLKTLEVGLRGEMTLLKWMLGLNITLTLGALGVGLRMLLRTAF